MLEPLVAIIILNYATYKMTLDCVELTKKQNYSNFFIIVVDNNSPNESSEILDLKYNSNKAKEKQDVYITFIKSDFNGGYSYGNNIGIREAERRGADYILILNNDVEISDQSFLEKSVAFMESNRKVGLMGPRVIDKGFYTNPLKIERPVWSQNAISNIFSLAKVIISKIVSKKEFLIINETRKVYTVSGCCMLFHTKYFKEIGYFDEGLFLFGEELVIGEKFHQKNIEVVFYSDLEVNHNHSKTISTFYTDSKITRIMDKSILYYFKNYRKDINQFQYGLLYLSFQIKNYINMPVIQLLVWIKKLLKSRIKKNKQ